MRSAVDDGALLDAKVGANAGHLELKSLIHPLVPGSSLRLVRKGINMI